MGWFEDQRRRDEAIREARRQSNEEAVQSAFTRGFRPQLVKLEPSSPPREEPPPCPERRAVEEDEFPPAGYKRFRVISSSGVLLLETLVQESIASQPGFVGNLKKFLDREDPQRSFKLI